MAARLFEQSQRDEGIQENGQGAQIALKSAGEFPSRQRRERQYAEEVQLRCGGQDRRALVAAPQGQDFFSRPRLRGKPHRRASRNSASLRPRTLPVTTSSIPRTAWAIAAAVSCSATIRRANSRRSF